MANYQTYPNELSVSDVSYKELILSDIVAKDVAFPPRRIFATMTALFLSQLSPDINGASNGDDAGKFTTDGGHAPIVFALVSGTGDTDNSDFTISEASLVWAITPTAGTRSIRVKATDVNGIEVEAVFSIEAVDTASCFSDDLTAAPIPAQWSVDVSQNVTVAYSGSGTQFDTTTTTPTTNYVMTSNFGGVTNGDTFLTSVDYSDLVGFASAFPTMVVARINITVGGQEWTFSYSINEDGLHGASMVVHDGTSYVATTAHAGGSGTLSVQRDGSDSLIFKIDTTTIFTGTVGTYPNNTGSWTVDGLEIENANAPIDTNWSTTLKTKVTESPIGTPYCT